MPRIAIIFAILLASVALANAAETDAPPADNAPETSTASATPPHRHHHHYYHSHHHRFHPVHDVSELIHHATGTQPVRPKPVTD
ncbi:MAG: hypothetical protein ABSG46_04675 [Candidatus Binataceae bacterium]